MAYYALVNNDNLVTEVITGHPMGHNVQGITNWEKYYSQITKKIALETSDNGYIRKNFAGIGYSYNTDLDAFIAPKPYSSWLLNEETAQWEAPIAYPQDNKSYTWDEPTISWTEITGE